MKPGYKQSEVGLIPVDWVVKQLGELGSVVRGGSPRPAGDPRYFNGDYIPWLTVAALTNLPDHQTQVDETFSFLTEEGSKRSRTLGAGTLIIANSGATLGVAKLLGITCCANDGVAAIVDQKSGDKGFICHYINSQTRRLREDVATGNGQPNLNTSIIRSISVPFPSLNEQFEISSALNDVDALLVGLDKLIAKKRDIKQATMQQLLTGKTRLPGFIDAWVSRKLGDLGSTYGGLVGKSKEDFGQGGAKYITFLNVMSNVVIDVDAAENVHVRSDEVQNKIQKGDLLFNGSSETPEEVAMCALVDTEMDAVYLNSFCFGFRFKQGVKVDGLFMAYQMRGPVGRDLVKSLAQGSTRYNLSKSAFLEGMLDLPSFDEQVAIASVLRDMDNELDQLEARREKTRLLKQGMMQELLTGRTRLV